MLAFNPLSFGQVNIKVQCYSNLSQLGNRIRGGGSFSDGGRVIWEGKDETEVSRYATIRSGRNCLKWSGWLRDNPGRNCAAL